MTGIKSKIGNKGILFMLMLSVTLACCTKQDREIRIAEQIKAIDDFAKSSVSSGNRLVVYKGSTRLVINEGTGESLMVGDSVFFDFAGYIFQSGLGSLFETNIESVALAHGLKIYNRGYNYGKNVVGKGLLINGLDFGLQGTKVGEHSYIVFPTNLGFYNKDVGLVPKMSPLIYEVWIKEVKKN